MNRLIRPRSLLLTIFVFLVIWIYWIFVLADDKSDNVTKNFVQIDRLSQMNSTIDFKRFSTSERKSIFHLIEAVRDIQSLNRTVLITLINDAYLPFAYSWLCNTVNMDVHKQVLIITTDATSQKQLVLDWPDVHVVCWPGLDAKGDQVYSHVGYVKLMITRSEILLFLLGRNVEMFLFEVDCLWILNPVQFLSRLKGYDLCVNPVATTNNYAGGLLYFFPTNKTKILWMELTERLQKLRKAIEKLSEKHGVSEGSNDQMFLSELVRNKYANIHVYVMDLKQYPDGKWYLLNQEERSRSRPYLINNNWLLGNKAKIERAKQWKHWFIHDDFSCDHAAVRNLSATFNYTKV